MWPVQSLAEAARNAGAQVQRVAAEPSRAEAEAAVEVPSAGETKRAAEGEEATDPAQSGASDPAGDVVESIADETGKASESNASPPPEPPVANRFELRGWARQSFELGFSHEGVDAGPDGSEALPYDRLVGRSQLFVAARYSHGNFFEANLSGLLEYDLREQGPPRPGPSFNLFNGRATATSYQAELRELFVAFFWHEFDLRIGQQRVAWGRADFISPNDVVNARDGRDPFVSEVELRTIPTPVVRGDANFSFGTFELVWAPIYVPDRADVVGSNWAGLQPDAPAVLRRFVNTSSADRGLAINLPKTDLTQSSLGARFSWTAHGFDVSHYYHYGFDGPFLALDPSVAAALGTNDLSRVSGDDASVLAQAAESGTPPVQVSFLRRHHIGLDAGTTVGPFGLRIDAAYQSNRAFFRSDLMSFASPTFLAVGSIEYQTGEREKGALLEGFYLRVLDDPRTRLLSYARDTVGVGAVVRGKLMDPLSFELRALVGVKPQMVALQPILVARFEALSFNLGGLWLGGDSFSYGSYYRRNRELFVRARYSF